MRFRVSAVAFSLVVIVLCVADAGAAPDHSRRPDCAMSGACSKDDRDLLICREDGRCRLAPPNWIDVVVENGGGSTPGGFAPVEDPDMAVVSVPSVGAGLGVAVLMLFGLRITARKRQELSKGACRA